MLTDLFVGNLFGELCGIFFKLEKLNTDGHIHREIYISLCI